MVIFRRSAKNTSFVWCISLDNRSLQMEQLNIKSSDNTPILSSAALAVRLKKKEQILVVNPNGLQLHVQMPDGSEWVVKDVFALKS